MVKKGVVCNFQMSGSGVPVQLPRKKMQKARHAKKCNNVAFHKTCIMQKRKIMQRRAFCIMKEKCKLSNLHICQISSQDAQCANCARRTSWCAARPRASASPGATAAIAITEKPTSFPLSRGIPRWQGGRPGRDGEEGRPPQSGRVQPNDAAAAGGAGHGGGLGGQGGCVAGAHQRWGGGGLFADPGRSRPASGTTAGATTTID